MKSGGTVLGLGLVVGSGVLIYSGFKNVNPIDSVKAGLGLGPTPDPGSQFPGGSTTGAQTTTTAFDTTKLAAATKPLRVHPVKHPSHTHKPGGRSTTPPATTHGHGKINTSSGCKPPKLVHKHGIALQPAAMAAYEAAMKEAGHISVTSSYRSCAQQLAACMSICGHSSCPGRCAPPGTSYHQKGLAIDLGGTSCRSKKVNDALKKNGWCAPSGLATSDPCHRSFGGCG
jgi:hypothetical protein